MNVRLTALSISSTHMKTMIALRRINTPATPSVNRIGGNAQGRSKQHQIFRLASTTAPTTAARSSTDVISNAPGTCGTAAG